MKLQIASDLHVEHRGSTKGIVAALQPKADTVLILAGDITSLKYLDQAKADMEELCEGWEHVFWVLGNHEYYGSHPVEAWNVACTIASAIPNLDLLNSKRVVDYKSKRFIGDTMWFPFDPKNGFYENMLSDFSLIRSFVPWVYDQNDDTLRDFNKNIQEGDIVITHHMPSPKSIHEQYAASSLNRFFLCDVTPLIEEKKPTLWIHGHTHEHFEYTIGSTRIIANPLGYPREMVDEPFNPQLIIDI